MGVDCCKQAQTSLGDLERAEDLQGQAGFEVYTPEAIAYRQERWQCATACDFRVTGQCALKSADMLAPYPVKIEVKG